MGYLMNLILEVLAKAIAPDVLAALAAIITALAPAILAVHKNAKGKVTWKGAPREPTDETVESHGSKVLGGFAIILIAFGAIAIAHYWEIIKQREDLAFTVIGLLLTMVGGMFVQVLTANYKSGSPLFQVTASQLAFPLLFSPIVFYPVWALTTSGSQHLFSFYAAFLDGYFWESVVSSAKPPNHQPRKGRLLGRRLNKGKQSSPVAI